LWIVDDIIDDQFPTFTCVEFLEGIVTHVIVFVVCFSEWLFHELFKICFVFLFVKLFDLLLLVILRVVHEEYKDIVLEIHGWTLFDCKLKLGVFTILEGNHTACFLLEFPEGTPNGIKNLSPPASTRHKNPILKSPVPHCEKPWFPIDEAHRYCDRFVLLHCAFASYTKAICLFLGFYLLGLYRLWLWDRCGRGNRRVEVLDNLCRESLETVHLLLRLAEFLEKEDNTEGTHDGGNHHNSVAVNGNHILMSLVFFLSNYTQHSLPWGWAFIG